MPPPRYAKLKKSRTAKQTSGGKTGESAGILKCTCPPSCSAEGSTTCEGECGCKKHAQDYNDLLQKENYERLNLQ
jgi:hypothetical protein